MLRGSKYAGRRGIKVLEADPAEGEWRVRLRVGREKAVYQVRDLDGDRQVFRLRKINRKGRTVSAYTCAPSLLACECEGRKRGRMCRHASMLLALARKGVL